MKFVEPGRKNPTETFPRLLLIGILLSLALHILVIVLLPLIPQDKKTIQQQPTMVQLVDKPKTIKKNQQEKPPKFELDQPPAQTPPTSPVESNRKADQDQRVEREQAPKGDDVRDQRAKPTPPSPPAPPKKPQPQAPSPVQKKPPQKAVKKKIEPPKKSGKKKSMKPPEKEQIPQVEVAPQQPPPDLFNLSPKTLDSINRGTLGQRNRTKQRDDVEIGDTVWLNLQNNLLVSFFRRFHDQIEMVWNYPTRAAQAGIEGTLQLLIVVNRKGELLDVDVIHTSGSDLLDYEAIQAVYRAAPFGPLSKHYPHDKLKIRANFSYHLGGRYIYGN